MPLFSQFNPAAWRPTRLVLFGMLGIAILPLAFTGCDSRKPQAVVLLNARALGRSEPREMEMRAQVATEITDLRYKWFADYGECDPQESANPLSIFKFAEGSKEDAVTVEVWRGTRRLGRTKLAVQDSAHAAQSPTPNVQIQITEVPPAAGGGPATRANISGMVTGDIGKQFKVVIYARDNGVWWVQPASRSVHEIRADHTWSTWTHTGQVYAAFLVREDFVPLRTYDVLPGIRGDIVGRVIVDGRTKEK